MNLKYLLFICVCIISVENKYILKQVVILSRHNVRTPLSKNLSTFTPKSWPNWTEKSGFLTAKGRYLEGLMGSYFSMWLHKEGLLKDGKCPSEKVFYAYANSKQRTKASAKAFVNKAFPKCDTIVHYKTKSDPIFNPVIHNTTIQFQATVLRQMKDFLKHLSLNRSLLYLQNILDYKNSELCRTYKKCDLILNKNTVHLDVGYKPNVTGPIYIAKVSVDAFIMSYYEGFPLKNVAWDLIKDETHWQLIMEITKGYHNVIFNNSLVAKDIATPLLKYMSNIFFNVHEKPKITLLMGHDANLLTILKSLDFKAYSLENQYEKSPVGGKLVFQKWFHEATNNNLLKINYVYQTREQLRNGLNLTLDHPPKFTLLELKQCRVDENGYCPWEDFILYLRTLL